MKGRGRAYLIAALILFAIEVLIALFIRDAATLWRLTGDATTLRLEFPVRAGGTRTAAFEVVGLDESKMPGW